MSGRLHRALAQWSGNPVFVRVMDELLPITTLLMAMYTAGDRPACVAHRHIELLDAFGRSGPAAAAEMKRHLAEIERSLMPQAPPPPAPPVRDVFGAYRETPPADPGTQVAKPLPSTGLARRRPARPRMPSPNVPPQEPR